MDARSACRVALHVACVAAAWLGVPADSSGQTVRGLVTDARTGEMIALATVTLVAESGERGASVLTTEEGFFSIDADDAGQFLVRVTALGYAPNRAGPLELRADALQVLEIRMMPAPLDIDGVVVEGRREGEVGNYLTQRGFWDRYAEGRGQFLTPGEVLASDAMFTPYLLRGLDQVVPQYGAAPWAIWPLLGITERRSCEPRVFVDDVWVNRTGFGIRESIGLDDVVPIERVQAVEVYHGPFQAPIRYQGTTRDNNCGVILIWTR